jgi:hypothetical protein
MEGEIGLLAPVLGIAPAAPQIGENRRLLIENAGLNSIAATHAMRQTFGTKRPSTAVHPPSTNCRVPVT